MENKNESILAIIDGCLNENKTYQRKLYEKFYGYGMSICLRYSTNQEEAKEMLNDAFLKVFKNLKTYDRKLPFKAWIRKIIINSAIDHFRKNKINKIDTCELKAIHEYKPDDDLFKQLYDNKDMLPIIQQLPPAYKVVFNLYVMEEYKHHEIAELLSISVGTSKSNLARAKSKIKEQLQKNSFKINVFILWIISLNI